MDVTEKTIAGLSGFLKEQQEADIVSIIAQRRGISANEALDLYFGSRIPQLIAEGAYGIQYLSAEYLADEALKDHDGVPEEEPSA